MDNLSEGKAVHPFFCRSSRLHEAPNSTVPLGTSDRPMNDTSVVPPPHDHSTCRDVPAHPSSISSDPGSLHGQASSLSTRDVIRSGPAIQDPEVQLQRQSCQTPLQSTTEEAKTSESLGHRGLNGRGWHSTNLDGALMEDPNHARRKRQRTESPSDEAGRLSPSIQSSPIPSTRKAVDDSSETPSWQMQLEAAASAGHDLADQPWIVVAASSPVAQEQALPQSERPQSHFLPSSPAIVPRSDESSPCAGLADAVSSESRPALLRETSPLGSLPSIASSAPDQQNSRKGKKMLGLSASGRLTSPTSRSKHPPNSSAHDSALPSKRQRRKKMKEMVVSVSYGHDPDSRQRIAHRIEQVLGTNSQLREEEHQPKSEMQRSKAPPKPTHPFFLVKAERAPSLVSLVRSGEHADEGVTSTSKPAVRAIGPNYDERAKAMGLDQRERSNGVARHNHPGNHGRLRDGSPPLLVQPEWPSAGLSHIRNFDPSEQLFMNRNLAIDSEPHRTTVKLKHIMVQVPLDEDLMMLLSTQLRLRTRLDRETLFVTDSMKTPLRKPKRDLICGQEIQDRVRKELRDSRTQQGDPGSGTIEPRRSSTFKHDALSSVFNKTRSSLTSYDLNQCESQQWINKYAPASAGEVLQAGAEASLLRNWLQKSTIRSIDTGNGAHASVDRIAVAGRRKKRRKRRAEELDGFIISSDEEADEMDEVTDPEDGIPSLASRQSKRSIIRSGDLTGFSKEAGPAKMTNAVVISGPRGCGKTATVYAIARELGFEVFEINAGSRRSGRDIVDKVGDMTRNHLVRRDERQRDKEGDWSTADEDELETVKALKRDIESGRQGTMNSFFKSKPNAETKRVPKAEAKPDTATVGKARPERTCTEQKQSLILLEEVDVLYDEDKQFWPAVLELIGQSRRPIIMTCNDESLIPWQQLSVHAVLRFSPPPERIAIDYLVLIAAKEGHLLRREAVRTLFMLKRGDLRACLMELDFWCQMGVGDSKGGLEWIYQRWPPGTDLDEQGRTLRVTSQDTYLSGMGLLSQDLCKESDSVAVNVEEELRLEAGETLAGDGGLDDQPQQMGPVPDDSEIDTRSSQRRRLELFQFEEGADNLSAVDVYGGVAKGLDVRLDPTQPRASQKTRCDDVQGYYNLETELMEQGHGLSRRMSICVRMLVDRCLHVGPRVNATRDGPQALEQYLIEDMSNVISSTHRANQFTPADLHDSLAPLAETPKSFLLPTSSGLTSIHRPTTLLAVDVAPYVRSIITSDQHLETQRRQLSNLLSEGGRNGKRVRTTRASRSALEGGKREETRRERWFRDVKINPRTVERTGGVGWQEVARWMVEGGEDDAQAESVSGASRGGGLSQESLGMEG